MRCLLLLHFNYLFWKRLWKRKFNEVIAPSSHTGRIPPIGLFPCRYFVLSQQESPGVTYDSGNASALWMCHSESESACRNQSTYMEFSHHEFPYIHLYFPTVTYRKMSSLKKAYGLGLPHFLLFLSLFYFWATALENDYSFLRHKLSLYFLVKLYFWFNMSWFQIILLLSFCVSPLFRHPIQSVNR